jgi:hypothetical protein
MTRLASHCALKLGGSQPESLPPLQAIGCLRKIVLRAFFALARQVARTAFRGINENRPKVGTAHEPERLLHAHSALEHRDGLMSAVRKMSGGRHVAAPPTPLHMGAIAKTSATKRVNNVPAAQRVRSFP